MVITMMRTFKDGKGPWFRLIKMVINGYFYCQTSVDSYRFYIDTNALIDLSNRNN